MSTEARGNVKQHVLIAPKRCLQLVVTQSTALCNICSWVLMRRCAMLFNELLLKISLHLSEDMGTHKGVTLGWLTMTSECLQPLHAACQ